MGRAPFVLLVAGVAFAGCPCSVSPSPCHEASHSGVVFIGTVDAVAPIFLDRWSLSSRPSLQSLNQADDRYQKDPSAQNLAAVKSTLLKLFPDIPAERLHQLQAATTHKQLVTVFDWVLGQGRRARFKVQTVFKAGGDDDKDDKDDKKMEAKDQVWEVWTPFGDCGFDFEPGETYLVYADTDEDTDIMETDRCSRTSRLTDAGPDLAYLYFPLNQPDASGRMEGFVTTNVLYQTELGASRDPDKISSPVAGAVIELVTGHGPRYTTSDSDGRFVFDGLATGDYTLSAYSSAYPEEVEVLGGPKKVHVDTKTCSTPVLLAPKAAQR